MSKQNSKVLKVYEQCETVLKLKRKFVQELYIPTLPNSQATKQTAMLKDYCTAYYIKIAVAKFFKETAESYSIYKNEITSKKAIESQIQLSIKKIKNTKDLTSRHQQLQNQLDQLKKIWEKEDPLIYYDVNERTKLKNSFSEKFNEFKESQSGIKAIKNPHFVHQLINQMKENLQKISEVDKKYDLQAQDNTKNISKYLRDLTKQMETNIDDIEYRSFIFQQKKKLFSQFIDIQEGSNGKNFRSSRHSNIVRHYFEELILVSKDIKQHYKRLVVFSDSLITFFKQVQSILKEQSKNFQKKYQSFIQQVFKNKQIRVILRIDVQQRINNSLKIIFSIGQILKGLPKLLFQYKNAMIECYNQANIYHDKYAARQLKYKETTDSFDKMLIEHKGFFSSLQKKEEKWNKINIETLRKFVRDLHQMMKFIYQENRQSKYKADINVHEMLNKIFAEYNFQEETKELGDSTNSADSKDLGLQAKIVQYEKFIDSIELFDFNTLNWSNPYFSCSLGPKLLLHGSLMTLQQGIYFQSSFNKKNLFFGKTRIFIPKTDIYEVNKQIALLIFPDVIQIKANKGEVYFHALGKRDKIYEQFINTYFPQVLQSQNGIDGEMEYEFNEFKGQSISDRPAFKLKPYAVDLGEATLKNSDLRVVFRRYFSDDPFTYQGKPYQNFKKYQLEHVGGLNPTSNQLTPPPPYYFMKKGEPLFSETVPDYSVRLATFQKKIPMIPFISKGGNGLCQEKIKYVWAGPQCFVMEIESIMKGFKLTEGMLIKIQSVFRQDNQKHQVKCSTSAQVSFESSGALTGTIKNEALAQLKQVMRKTIQAMQKNQKNRSIYKNKGNNLMQVEQQKQDYKDEIQKLKNENNKLNKKFKIAIVIFVLIYLFTIFSMKLGGIQPKNEVEVQKKKGFFGNYYGETDHKDKQQKNEEEGFWSFL